METIFLCHASSDKPFVRRIATALEARAGVKVWLDEEEILVGDSLRDSIERGLTGADYVLVALSKNAITRRWVHQELNAAMALETEFGTNVVLPALIEHVDLPVFLKDKKYVDFSIDFDQAIDELIRLFERDRSKHSSSRIISLSTVVTMRFCDIRGHRVEYEKIQELLCVVSGVGQHSDGLQCDGTVSDFEIAPGNITGTEERDGMLFVLSTFDSPLRAGERLHRKVRCVMTDSFLSEREFWWIQKWHRAENVTVVLDFPMERHPDTWALWETEGAFERQIEGCVESDTVDKRFLLRADVSKVRLGAKYVLRWQW